MTDEDQVSFSSSPPGLEHMETRFEDNAEQDYKKARDESLPISEVNKQPSVLRIHIGCCTGSKGLMLKPGR